MDECKGQTLTLLQKKDTEQNVLNQIHEDIAKFSDEESITKTDPCSILSDVVLTKFRKDGSSFRNHLKIYPMLSDDGKIRYFGGVLEPDESEELPSKLTNKIKTQEKMYVLCGGILLSFNSGYINGCCLSGLLLPSGRHQSVSAFTGTYTLAGLFLADGNFDEFGFASEMILSFIFGAFLCGLLNPESKPYQLGPSYGPSFILGAISLLIASALAIWDDKDDYTFYFAAIANGIQNGMSSSYSGNLIRSTHLTGTSTDIGLILGQIVRGNYANVWKFFVLTCLALSFWLGGVISFFSVQYFKSTSLVFNAGLFLAIGIGCIIYLMKANDITLIQAITGNWHWDKVIETLKINQETEVLADSLLEIFDSIDVDGSGQIDQDELYEALKRMGLVTISIEQVQEMLMVADTDGDGFISKDEWINIVTNKLMKRKNGMKRTLSR